MTGPPVCMKESLCLEYDHGKSLQQRQQQRKVREGPAYPEDSPFSKDHKVISCCAQSMGLNICEHILFIGILDLESANLFSKSMQFWHLLDHFKQVNFVKKKMSNEAHNTYCSRVKIAPNSLLLLPLKSAV